MFKFIKKCTIFSHDEVEVEVKIIHLVKIYKQWSEEGKGLYNDFSIHSLHE